MDNDYDVLSEISDIVNQYNEGADNWDIEMLQYFRDRLSMSFFLSAAKFADIRASADALNYEYKKCMAEYEEHARVNPQGGKKLTRDQVRAQALISCDSSKYKAIEADRNYYRIKQVQEAVPQIIHAISSRLNNINKF